MYGNSLYEHTISYGSVSTIAIIAIVALILAIIGGIVILLTFAAKKNEYKFTGFLGWMHKFLNFKTMFAETLLKALYIISACYITLYALGFLLFTSGGSIGGKLLTFIITITLGNVILRLVFEFCLVILVICKNTSDINSKLGAKDAVKAEEANKPVQSNTETQQAPVAAKKVFCTNCGQQMTTEDLHCPSCGHPRQ